MSFVYSYTVDNSQRYSTTDSILYKHQDRFNQHISALIRIERNNNDRVCINPMLSKIICEIISEGYSPYTLLTDEYIMNKLTTVRLEDIINKGIEWIIRFKLCRCNIFSFCNNSLELNYNRNILFNIVKYYIVEYGVVPGCRMILLNYHFYIQEKRVGTIQEITEYESLLYEIENNPDEFHDKHKHKIPTKNLAKLKSNKMTDELFKNKEPCCGICQSEIEVSQTYFELNCGHQFHEKDEQCLEYATIISWLKDNKLCPICKQEVLIE